MSDSVWRIGFAPSARRDMRRLDPQVRRRVIAALERLASGDPSADVRKLKGHAESRLRVGEWRVRFKRNQSAGEIIVLRVLPRGRAYRD